MNVHDASIYYPIEILFHLLCVLRRGQVASVRMLSNAVKRRGVQPNSGKSCQGNRAFRISFWIRLAHSAGLIDESQIPHPTLLVEDWLSWNLPDQIHHLLRSWIRIPASAKNRRIRAQLIDRLSNRNELSSSHCSEINGLQILGICNGMELSSLGRYILLASLTSYDWQESASRPWHIEAEILHIPFPPNWKLAWELESYIEPLSSGSYPLDERHLRQAVQRGAISKTPTLIDILSSGLGQEPPEWLMEKLISTPTLRLIPGPVLEFSHPSELVRLRKQKSLRKSLNQLLSSRHVALSRQGTVKVVKRLYRHGLLSENDLAQIYNQDPTSTLPAKTSASHLPISARIYLLTLHLLALELPVLLSSPHNLRDVLSEGLDHFQRAAAASKASAALAVLEDSYSWQPELEPVDRPLETIIETIERAIHDERSIDIIYQSASRSTPEFRHITPLLVEFRGGRGYLIAYCHNRRANRTFRLDRLRLVDH